MRDYSLDSLTEQIHSSKTREYFNEVIKSYYNESYRSAVVMLYSIAISDLLFKIEELKDIYSDQAAVDIITEITAMQVKNPTSPDWESKLIDLVKEKTNLLEPADHLHLVTLQKQRHLCAHPIITQNFELYSPNKETTRAHIRNILEGLLVKPAFLSRKVFDSILHDLASVKHIIYDETQLEKHLTTKFFSRLNQKALKLVFRSLWKIVFKISDKKCEENRNINLKALNIMLRQDYSGCLEAITNEKDYFSDINVDYIGFIIPLLNHFSGIFQKLNDSIQILIRNTVAKDADLDTFAVFLSADVNVHIEKVLAINWNSGYERDYITTESINAVFEYALREGKRDLAYEFIIKMFSNSGQYADADIRFENLIQPQLGNFNSKELKKIVAAVNNNSQIHDRRKARSANNLIRARVDELSDNKFDYSKYSNFK
ncbi:MAG: hypothetical protein V4539_16265 [Bacteroidota bacterium]